MSPIITIPASLSGVSYNVTPAVRKALDDLSLSGGTLTFEKGEYHFFEEGAEKYYSTHCYNTKGEKHVAFPLLVMNDITLDGNDSVFVFHGRISPFIVSGCRNVTIRNCVLDNSFPSLPDAKAVEITDDGFVLAVDRSVNPFKVDEGGHLIFEREGFSVDTAKLKLSLHAVDRMNIKYIFCGDCEGSKENLAAPYMDTYAVDLGDRIGFKYREGTQIKYPFALNEPIVINLEDSRYRSVFVVEDCRDVTIEDIVIRRGGGFGFLSQMTENLTVRRVNTDTAFHGERMSLTADAFHIVNNSGLFTIEDCKMSSFLDDVCNIHGTYAIFEERNKNNVKCSMGHKAHAYCRFIKDGDKVRFIDVKTMDIVAEGTASNIVFDRDDGQIMTLDVAFDYGKDALTAGCLIENPNRMPDVIVRGCDFSDHPHFRISGSGKMLVENCYIHDCSAAFLISDLWQYWYESGRVKDLTIRNNVFDNCNKLGGSAFISIGIDGHTAEDGVKVHDTVRITDNEFKNLKSLAIQGFGVKNLILENNTLDGEALPERLINVK